MIPDIMRVLHNHSLAVDDNDYTDDSAGGELIFSDSHPTNKNPNGEKSLDYSTDYSDLYGNPSSLGSKGLLQMITAITYVNKILNSLLLI
jgi:hypothetical protein